jgi:hypothetical protein
VAPETSARLIEETLSPALAASSSKIFKKSGVRLVGVSLIANTGPTTSYKALQNSKIMIK